MIFKKKRALKLPQKKRLAQAGKHSLLAVVPVLPQLAVIAFALGLYYAMQTYYVFFSWGIYLYYGLKILVAFALLSGSTRSLGLPLAALVFGLLVLFTNNVYINTLMNADTAWELNAIALIGILTALFIKK